MLPVGQLFGSNQPGGLYSFPPILSQPNKAHNKRESNTPGCAGMAHAAPNSHKVGFGLRTPPGNFKGAGFGTSSGFGGTTGATAGTSSTTGAGSSGVGVGAGLGEGVGVIKHEELIKLEELC